MTLLPIEILHIIAAESEASYRALLSVPQFARSLDVSTRIDFMILFGHSVKINNEKITWLKHGRRYCNSGPAVIYVNGSKFWMKNGLYHRVGGPAVELFNGYKEWYHNGVLHRVDGPARIYSDGDEEWIYDSVKVASTRGEKLIWSGDRNELIPWIRREKPEFDPVDIQRDSKGYFNCRLVKKS